MKLTAEFGRGFDECNLSFMLSFYTAFPKMNAVRSALTWPHSRLLLRLDKPEARLRAHESAGG